MIGFHLQSGGQPGFQTQMLTCGEQECKFAWKQDTPTFVRVSLWAAFVRAIRCPACGSAKVMFGYTPTPEMSAEEATSDALNWPDIIRFLKWVEAGDTGLSSMAIARHMAQRPQNSPSVPADPSDLGRCLRLLRRFPMWKDRMHEMASVSPAWARLVANGAWERLTTLMETEVGLNWEKGNRAPATDHALSKLLQGEIS